MKTIEDFLEYNHYLAEMLKEAPPLTIFLGRNFAALSEAIDIADFDEACSIIDNIIIELQEEVLKDCIEYDIRYEETLFYHLLVEYKSGN